MNTRKVLILAVGVVLALALAGVVSAKPAAPANQLNLHGQEIHGGILLVDSITAAQPGWLVVYKRPGMDSDSIVGYAPVKQGLNQNVRVTLDTKALKDVSTLWARLHVDQKPVGTFEWGLKNRAFNDPPAVENGQEIVTAFATSGDAAPLDVVPSITIKNQDVKHTNPIIVENVTTPVDGWLVIYKDGPAMGPVVGFAPVYEGTNTNVKVAIDTSKLAKNQPALYAVLQADQGTHGLFEWVGRYTANPDAPYGYQGHMVMTGFATTTP